MKKLFLASILCAVSSIATAESKSFTLQCADEKNQATIMFSEEILADVCADRSTEHPELSFTINGENNVWNPAPLFAMCARPINKTMLQFRKSIDEQVYIEIDHKRKTATASIRLKERHFNMTCQ